MRRIALIISSAVTLLTAAFSVPVTAAAAPPPYGTHVPGPHSGAISPRSPVRPARTPTMRVPSTVSSPVACDQGFDLVSTPNAANYNYLVATAVIAYNDIWAVGNNFDINTATGNDQTLAQHWDGSTWTIVPTLNPGPYRNDLTGVSAVSSSDVWAVGYYQSDAQGRFHTFAEHWNGLTWSLSLTTANPSSDFSLLFAVTAISTSEVWAVGTYQIGVSQVPMAQHYNGSTWSNSFVMNPGLGDTNGLFSISAWSSTDIWAVGSVVTTQGTPPLPPGQPLAEHYDGASWTIKPTGTLTGDNEILAVTALEANHAEGVGYGSFVSAVSARQSAGWDLTPTGPGTVTNLVSTLSIPGTGDNALLAVDRSGDTLWAGGYLRGTPALAAPRATLAVPASWNATTHTLTWRPVGVSADPSALNDVFLAMSAVSPNVFWGVGYQTNVSGVDQTFAAMECAVHFQVGAPLTATTGSGFSVSVTALNSLGFPATNYVGTVHFTSSDPLATLPADYRFVTGDAGARTFAGVALRKPYQQTITVTDTVTPFITARATVSAHCPGVCQSTAVLPSSRGVSNPSGSGVPRPPRIPAQSPAASSALRLARRFSLSGGAEPAPGARSRQAFPRPL